MILGVFHKMDRASHSSQEILFLGQEIGFPTEPHLDLANKLVQTSPSKISLECNPWPIFDIGEGQLQSCDGRNLLLCLV
jgi:hypothetical protein